MKIRVTRPLLFNGVAYAAGALIEVTALQASDALASGRAVLADPADGPRVDEAANEAGAALLRKLGAGEAQAAVSFLLRRRRA